MALLHEQLDHEEHETEVYAKKVRETKHSVVKILYTKLMRDTMQHTDVINCAISYLATNAMLRYVLENFVNKKEVVKT